MIQRSACQSGRAVLWNDSPTWRAYLIQMNQMTGHRNHPRGMTLLEMTVVIAVLLTLIVILFWGARAWKRSSDRSTNIVNIRNVQYAVRGLQYAHNLAEGDALLKSAIIPSYINEPEPPSAGLVYTYGTEVPPVGVLYLTVGGPSAPEFAPAAGSTDFW
jgi:prepilin-type N-terminal cleavage/methylation domain-containing protein